MPLIEILKRSSDPVATFNKDLQIIHWNHSIEKHTGISAAEAAGRFLYQLLPDLEKHLDSLIRERILEEQIPVEYLHDLNLKTKTGSAMHATAALFPYRYVSENSDHTISGGVILLYPYSKTALLPPKLSKLLVSVPHYSSEAIIITEAAPIDPPEGPAIVYVNRAFTEMTGYREIDVLGKTPRILQGPKTDEKTMKQVKAALQHKEPIQAEILNYRKDGTTYWVEINIVPVKNEAGWYTHFISVQRDITGEVRAKRLLESTVKERTKRLREAVEDLEAFAYSASHDLKQPLRSVTTHLGLLNKKAGGTLSPEHQEYIDKAVQGAHSMYRLLEGILHYSRYTKTDGVHQEEVDTQVLCSRKINELKAMYPDCNFQVHWPAQPLPKVMGYAIQLEQVFQNLLANAINYTDKAKVSIHLDCVESSTAYRFSVSDNGPGIPNEERKKIFQLFSRNHHHTEGTGLGLAICKRILQRHGGHIGLEPYREGEGATFFFTIPKPGAGALPPSPAE